MDMLKLLIVGRMHAKGEKKYMNNKGFAITTIIFGLFILFMLLLMSFLGICANYIDNLSKLIDATGGARDIITTKPITSYASKAELISSEKLIKSGCYCFDDGCEYISKYNFN